MAYTHNALTGLLLYQFRADIQKYIPIKEMGILSDNWAENYFRNDFSHSFWAERIIRNQPSSLFASVIDKFRQYRFSQIMRLNSDILPRGVPINNEKLHFILEDVIDWIQSILLKISTPFFAYIHLYPPHRPYCTRYDFVDKFKDRWKPPKKTHHYFSRGYNQAELLKLRRYYDEYLAYADAEFGRLWDFIQGSGLVDNTYIIFTSDHGEMFERGIWEHLTPTLYDPLIKIPLIISKPGLDQRKDVYSLTSSIDLYPTILKIASIKVPSWSEGSLLPTFGGEQVDKDRNIYAFEAKRSSKWGSIQEGTIALIQGNQKMIHYFGYPGFDEEYEFYNLEEDPEEIKDIYDLRDPNVVRLHEELRYKLKDISPQ
jgi:arylsulfatase A-like enzyme